MIKNRLKKIVNGFRGRRPSGDKHIHPVGLAVSNLVQTNGFVVVQLGAHVGNTANDPIFRQLSSLGSRRSDCKVLLVEPIKEHFTALKQSYSSLKSAVFENVAVSDRSGPATIHRLGVKPEDHGYPPWLSQLSSLKEAHINESLERDEGLRPYRDFLLEHLVSEAVDCVTFEELMERHNIERIDLLQIDVEGFEFDILRTINFVCCPIRFLNYERAHLGDIQAKCIRLVKAAGFEAIDHGLDTFCFRSEDPLAAQFSEFIPSSSHSQ